MVLTLCSSCSRREFLAGRVTLRFGSILNADSRGDGDGGIPSNPVDGGGRGATDDASHRVWDIARGRGGGGGCGGGCGGGGGNIAVEGGIAEAGSTDTALGRHVTKYKCDILSEEQGSTSS